VILKQSLLRVKTKALRLNVWFKTLSRTERAIMDLTVKCVEQIRSQTLEAAILTIMNKILDALQNRFLSNAEKIGREIAEKLGEIAEKWGHESASSWKFDTCFIKFLGINAANCQTM
jgi:guanylate kinase